MEGNQVQAHLFDGLPVNDTQSGPLCAERNTAKLTETIQKKGWAFLRVSGKSMFPWIRPDDLVFLRRALPKDVARGDVIVFEKSGTLCVHRVLSLQSSGAGESAVAFITKGDATADADDTVSSAEFRGKVEFVYRRNREICIATGWRKYFGKFLTFISPATRWWKPASSVLQGDTARCELLGMRNIEARHSAENSSD
jgi:signal peptidase I